MIGKLRGIVDAIGLDQAIIDVGGVGYEVACSSRTLGALPSPGEPVVLSIETHVREDAIKLYGFLSEAERGWFRLLQSAPGVGPKVALRIVNELKDKVPPLAISGGAFAGPGHLAKAEAVQISPAAEA